MNNRIPVYILMALALLFSIHGVSSTHLFMKIINHTLSAGLAVYSFFLLGKMKKN